MRYTVLKEVPLLDETDRRTARYDNAIMLLPQNLRDRARRLVKQDRAAAEELRFRVGQPVSVLLPEGEVSLRGDNVTVRDLENMLDIATGASAHSARESLQYGYITVRGGYRIGLCGTVLCKSGKPEGFKILSSAALRISREITGAADGVLGQIFESGRISSTLIVSPPGMGKTTLLRDLIRQISCGCVEKGIPGFRVGLADERGEVSAICGGVPQMDIGTRTDILDACPKAEAVLMLLRTMNPQVIALDEITAPEDIDAVERASHCGVKIIATAHAEEIRQLWQRPLYRRLMSAGVFEKTVLIGRDGRSRSYTVSNVKAVM